MNDQPRFSEQLAVSSRQEKTVNRLLLTANCSLPTDLETNPYARIELPLLLEIAAENDFCPGAFPINVGVLWTTIFCTEWIMIWTHRFPNYYPLNKNFIWLKWSSSPLHFFILFQFFFLFIHAPMFLFLFILMEIGVSNLTRILYFTFYFFSFCYCSFVIFCTIWLNTTCSLRKAVLYCRHEIQELVSSPHRRLLLSSKVPRTCVTSSQKKGNYSTGFLDVIGQRKGHVTSCPWFARGLVI